MNWLLPSVAQILHVILMLAAAPAMAAAADFCAARFAGRAGAPLLAPWRDLVRLARKTPALLDNVSAVSRCAPVAGFAVTLAACALVPSFSLGMALSPLADLLVVIALLTAGRIIAASAAFDSGSALPGLDARQDGVMAPGSDAALMLVAFCLASMAGSFDLDAVITQQRDGLLLPAAASAVTVTALLALAFADSGSGRSANDQMFSGTDLALVRLTGWLRRLAWIDLIGGLFLPFGLASAEVRPLDWLIGLACWTIRLAVFTVGIAAAESVVGRVPRRAIPDLVGVAALLALLATIMVLASTGIA
jgi:formate hydrogenlyase subunit 4